LPLVSPTALAQATANPKTAPAGWQSLGPMPAPAWDGHTLLFHNNQGELAVTPESDDIVRVRFTTAATFGRNHSYAVVLPEPAVTIAKKESNPETTILTT